MAIRDTWTLKHMATLTIDMPEELRRALRVRAARHGWSIEAEVREILAVVVKPRQHIRMGDALAAIGRQLMLDEGDMVELENLRDRNAAAPSRFD